MRHQLKFALCALAVVACTADGCDQTIQPTANQRESNQQNRGIEQLHRNQPAPTVTWSLDRQIVIAMFMARQQGVVTYSVVYDKYAPAGSRIQFACPSMGYPVPYSTQITNPHTVEKVVVGYVIQEPGAAHTDTQVVDQAEPNGLFPPPASAATWVPCVGESGKLEPIYEEGDVSTFPYPVEENAKGRLVRLAGAKSSVSIDASH